MHALAVYDFPRARRHLSFPVRPPLAGEQPQLGDWGQIIGQVVAAAGQYAAAREQKSAAKASASAQEAVAKAQKELAVIQGQIDTTKNQQDAGLMAQLGAQKMKLLLAAGGLGLVGLIVWRRRARR